jgi:hypothetical protein
MNIKEKLMSKAVLITPEWDVVAGAYIVAEATVKGLGEVSGETREEFQKNLRDVLGEVEETIIAFSPEDRVILRNDLH